ncbi:MAG: glycosyltransferase [Acidobacteria bacterium]|nr:glycosyltransferase [Acidobacteriota bacterium]
MLKREQITATEISVVIPVHNRLHDLQIVLRALSLQDFPKEKFEVILCDDGSTEAISSCVGWAENLGLNLSYFRQEKRGPASARNLGIRRAAGKIIAMTDNDTLPDRAWLRQLDAALAEAPEAVGVEGRVCAPNELEFFPLGEGPINKSGNVYLTCNCAYRREALVQAGGFDETFPYPAYEDTDLASQLQQFGPILWQPDAVVYHPQRPLTLRAVLKKLTHWEYVLITAFRYGYFAWPQYPTKHPRIRAIALSVIALPLSKLKDAMRCAVAFPAAAAKLFVFGIAECLGALVLVVPKALFINFRSKAIRGRYLD